MKKISAKFFLVIITFTLLFVVASCGKKTEKNTKDTTTNQVLKNSYEITYELNGGVNDSNNPTSYKKDSQNITLLDPTKAGYSFLGWEYEGKTISSIDTSLETPITLTAKWKANTNTKYKVEHYKENLDNDLYTLADTDNLEGETDTLTKAIAKDYSDFVKPEVTQEKIKGDESTVIKLYYEIERYNITTLINNEDAGSIVDKTNSYKLGSLITLEATANPGYTFFGWFVDNNKVSDEDKYEIEVTSDVTYTAIFMANTDITYKVEHYKENIDNYDYSIAFTDDLFGETNALTKAESKGYAGFKEPEIIQQRIKADGSTVVKLYYNREVYKITTLINDQTAGSIVDITNDYKYESTITLNATANPGYTFYGWFIDTNKVYDDLKINVKVEKTLTYTAKFMANNDIPYTVEHYLENIDNNKYTLFTTDSLYGKTNDLTVAKSKGYEGFSEPTIVQEKIKADGSTVIKLYYARESFNLTMNVNDTNMGSITDISGIYKFEKPITLEAKAKDGYRFVGWKYIDSYISNKETFETTMAAFDVTVTATFVLRDDISYKVEHYQENINDNKYTIVETENLTGNAFGKTNAKAIIYMGFNTPEVEQIDINLDGSTVVKIYYERKTVNITVSINNEAAGSIVDKSGLYKYGSSIKLEATLNDGYSFNGWYKGENLIDTKLNTTIKVEFLNDETYTAIFSVNTDTPYKVVHYLENANKDLFEIDKTDYLKGETNTLTNASAYSYDGFESPTITQELIKGDGSTVIKLYYSRLTFNVTVDTTMPYAEITDITGTYKYGQTVELEVISYSEGYTFLGWYFDGLFKSDEENYSFTMPKSDLAITASFTNIYNLKVKNLINDESVTLTGSTNANYTYNTSITLSVNNNTNKNTCRWVRSDGVTFFGSEYTFTMPSTDLEIEVSLRAYVTISDTQIKFGSYPQNRLTKKSLIESLNKVAKKPTDTDLNGWIDYGYYIEKNVVSYMYYKDITRFSEGVEEKFRGVYFTQLRPRNYNAASSEDISYQDEYGYTTNNVYWFRFTKITWNIINKENGKALVIPNLALDAQAFEPTRSEEKYVHSNGEKGYGNNYELSFIRNWLNTTFYETAFSELEKELIDITTVKNDKSQFDPKSYKEFECNDTNDKIFLLSYYEANTYLDEDSRKLGVTDYAKCQGVYTYKKQLDDETEKEYTDWLLRTPGWMSGRYSDIVKTSGKMNISMLSGVDGGIVPACVVIL